MSTKCDLCGIAVSTGFDLSQAVPIKCHPTGLVGWEVCASCVRESCWYGPDPESARSLRPFVHTTCCGAALSVFHSLSLSLGPLDWLAPLSSPPLSYLIYLRCSLRHLSPLPPPTFLPTSLHCPSQSLSLLLGLSPHLSQTFLLATPFRLFLSLPPPFIAPFPLVYPLLSSSLQPLSFQWSESITPKLLGKTMVLPLLTASALW